MSTGPSHRPSCAPTLLALAVACLLAACVVSGCAPESASASADQPVRQPLRQESVSNRPLRADDFLWAFWGAAAPCPPLARLRTSWTDEQHERWCELDDGTHHGISAIWFPSGRLQWRVREVYGRREGVETEYNTSGQLRRRAHWHDNDLVGVQTWWSPEGEPTSACRYLQGTKLHCWDPRSEAEPSD